VIHRRRRFCHVGELNVENEINVLNLKDSEWSLAQNLDFLRGKIFSSANRGAV
jgi:hypothetical protein